MLQLFSNFYKLNLRHLIYKLNFIMGIYTLKNILHMRL